jgi:hypothetical protein
MTVWRQAAALSLREHWGRFQGKKWSERRDSNPRHKIRNPLNASLLQNMPKRTIHKYAHRFWTTTGAIWRK